MSPDYISPRTFDHEYNYFVDPYRVERVDFARIPIHIHQIDFNTRARITSVKPGIHYAVSACTSEAQLRSTIITALNASVNDQNMPPAGSRRGVLPDLGQIAASFSLGECDILYDLGINPIVRRQGMFIIWGNLFVTPYGRKERMIGLPDSKDPMRRGRPHTDLYRLVSPAIWNAP